MDEVGFLRCDPENRRASETALTIEWQCSVLLRRVPRSR
jgi:hypothetical protein